MTPLTSLGILFLAATLEAGGDALVRMGLGAATLPVRLGLFVLGGAVLFAYGVVVNTPSWNFGRLLGIYVVCFFFVSQVISWLVFHQPPGTGVLVGGAFIIVGGVIMSTWMD